MTTTVSSEVHQDLLFLDSIGSDLFVEADQNDTQQEQQLPEEITTKFTSTPRTKDQAVLEIVIEHFRSSTVPMVGLQVWRGALLLADFLLSNPDPEDGGVRGRHVLELAAGTGVTSIVAATMAKAVVCTDVDRGNLLPLIRRNFERNSHLFGDCDFEVAELDFFNASSSSAPIRDRLDLAEVILVADVVYDRDITEAFFDTLASLIRDCRRLQDVLFAVEERRRVGSDGHVLAPNFKHFAEKLTQLAQESCPEWTLAKVPLNFHQHFLTYERVAEMHMWRLKKIIKKDT